MRTVEEIQEEILKVGKAKVAALRKLDRCDERIKELKNELAEERKSPKEMAVSKGLNKIMFKEIIP